MRLCAICAERPRVGTLLCFPCAKAWDRFNKRSDGTHASALHWAAQRARRFLRRRHVTHQTHLRQVVAEEQAWSAAVRSMGDPYDHHTASEAITHANREEPNVKARSDIRDALRRGRLFRAAAPELFKRPKT